jgi:chemotaxis response regulator CheB
MTPNPLALLSNQATNSYGPSAEETGEGVTEQLKQVMAIAVAVSGAAPDLAENMRGIRQLAMKSLMQTQQSGSSSGMAPAQ